MPIIAKSSGNEPREIIPVGTYAARCYQMLHIGTVETNFNGETKMANKVRIGWELPEELKTFDESKGPQPLVISKEFTLSMHEKSSLRSALQSWRGKNFTKDEAKAFDITKLIGAPCMLGIIHVEKKDGSGHYASITSVGSLMKGMKVPPAINPPQILTYDGWDEDLFQSLPDFLKTKIMSSQEYQAMKAANTRPVGSQASNDESDLPF